MPALPRVLAALDEAGISYDVMPCDPELADTAAFCRAYGIDPAESANTIVVASRRPSGVMAACVALATTRLDVNGAVRTRMGVKKVSFAPADTTAEVTGMEMGGVTPAGLPAGLPVWVDGAVARVDSVVVGAGTRTAKIRLAGSDIQRIPGVEVIKDLARPAEDRPAPQGDGSPDG
jgi:prolyl-tRNA editing enzyme YbaK/EbsC (Cys-tRNA(Pro) deacylase)